MLEDEKKWNAQLAVFEVAMFLPKDIEVIRRKGSARELVGAALQVKVGDKNIPALTRAAFSRGSNDPVVLTGIATRLGREIANNAQGANSLQDIYEVLTALERLEPENGLPSARLPLPIR